MKRTTVSKTIPFLTSLIVSSFAFGLFVLVPQFVQRSPGDVILSEDIRQDTIRNTRANTESNEAVASGDGYFAKKDYLNAKAAYQLAVDLNPANTVAREKLQKTMELLRSQKAQNVLFDVAVAAADKLFQAKEYEKAKLEYENASKLLPDNPYPKNRINEIIKIQVDLKVKEEEYSKAILSGDKAFNTNNLQLALLDYKKASGLKPEEKYPQQRIKEINDRLALQKQKDDAYNKAIQLADQNFKASRYADAKKSYQDALVVKPEQVYPKNRITEIDGLLARILKSQQDYDRYVANGDSLYIEKQYLKARENYLMASSVKPNESYPREMVIKADKMLTGQEAALAKALEEQYSRTIADADRLFAENQLEPSRAEYVKASNLKPAENYPKEKIRQIDESFSAALRNKDEAYQKAIAAGDKALAAKVLEMAKSEFESALKIKPGETYPRTKLEEIDKLMALENARKAEDAKYTDAIATGDSLFFAKSWQPARAKFQAALVLKPKEAYPRNRIAEIDAKLAEMEKDKAKEAQYNNLIAKADKELKEKQFQMAKDDYTKASSMKPEETYPKEKISEIEFILADLAKTKALDERYRNLIAQADKQLSAKSYPEARISYTDAAALKPTETYPQSKIAEIDKILADLAARKSAEENYQALITSADDLLAAKLFPAAREEYLKAGGIKPTEQYPKTKIAEIDKVLAEMDRQQALDAEYAAAIAQGDKLLDEKALNEAKASFQKAQKAKPSEIYPGERIAVIDKLLADQAAQRSLDEKYQAAIKLADDLFGKKSYETSRNTYNNALAIKPGESYPQTRISEIDRILADQAAQKEIDDRFRATIAKADQFFTAKSYAEAKTEYQAALVIKLEEIHPKNRITEIEKIEAEIAAKKSLDENYLAAITQADNLLASKSYEASRTEYVKAQALKPQEKYPATKISEIDAALAEIARKNALEAEYGGIIAEADRLMGEKSYTDAKSKYQAALKLKPAESYPAAKIAEADKALQEMARLKALDDQYQTIIVKADNLLAQKSYEQAKTEYQNSLSIKPGESYPQTRIGEIGKILSDLAAQKAIDDNYKASVARADQLFTAKSYAESKTEYQAALVIKPEEIHPKNRIAEIEKIEAEIAAKKSLDENYAAAITQGDNLLASKSYEASRTEYVKAQALKPQEKYPATKISEIDAALAEIARKNALEAEYGGIIADADRLMGEKSYFDAKSKYQTALKLKPAETYPATKIAEADKALQELARLKALDDQYQAIIAKADNLLAQKSYEQAKTEYQNSLSIKPGQKYPAEKIADIDKTLADIAAAAKKLQDDYNAAVTLGDKLLASKSLESSKAEYTKALSIKPGEVYPTSKIREIDEIMAENARKKAIDDEYSATVAAADQLLTEKSFESAKLKYQHALTLKPGETLPKEKITLIDREMADKARQKAIDDQYQAAIAEADKLFQSASYDQARATYTKAGNLKPSETLPVQKIKEIDALLAAMEKQRALDENYRNAIARADQQLNAKSYDLARNEFTNASTLKPEEQYPKTKIAEIDGILEEIRIREEAYKAAITAADQLLAQRKYEESRTEYQKALEVKPQDSYARGKLAEIGKAQEELLGKQKYYDNLIADADRSLLEKDYCKAKDNYQRALGVFPDNAYPKERIAKVTATIDSIYRVNKSKYDKAVGDGDRFYNNYEYDKAIDAYSEAASLLPMENYPREMIVKIRRTIAENAIADVLNGAVIINSNDEKQFTFTPINFASRKNNFVYIKIRNLSGKPFNVLMRYGKDKQSNGGVVMRNISIDGNVNERLVSVRDQDLWSREDNNWISLIPQGGDIEVSFIQVSRARQE